MDLRKKVFYIMLITIIALLFNIEITNAVNVEITTETLNLREEPSTDSDIVAQISIGDDCELIEDEGDWYHVRYGEYTGYISSEYAQIVGDSSDNSNNENTNTTDENNNTSDNNAGENSVNNSTDNTTNEGVNSADNNNVTETNESNKNVTATLNQNTSIKILPLVNSSNLENINRNSEVTVITQINGWSYIQTDEISGWVRSDTLTIQNSTDTNTDNNDNNTSDNSSDNNNDNTDDNNGSDNSTFERRTMYTNDTYVNIRAEASTSSDRIMVVEQNTALTVIGETGDWYIVETSQGNAYVSKELLSEERTTVTNRGNVERTSNTETQDKENEDEAEEDTSTSNSVKGLEIVEYAKEFLGVPYVYGGASPSGFDCSGFTMYVYNHFGISMRHGAQAQAKLGEEVSADKNSKSSLLNNLQVGDLVFFLDYETMDEIGHCGIYIGDGNFIHASSGSGYCVKINSLLPGEYYNTRYCAARRII